MMLFGSFEFNARQVFGCDEIHERHEAAVRWS
jgi:hypothetical protein